MSSLFFFTKSSLMCNGFVSKLRPKWSGQWLNDVQQPHVFSFIFINLQTFIFQTYNRLGKLDNRLYCFKMHLLENMWLNSSLYVCIIAGTLEWVWGLYVNIVESLNDVYSGMNDVIMRRNYSEYVAHMWSMWIVLCITLYWIVHICMSYIIVSCYVNMSLGGNPWWGLFLSVFGYVSAASIEWWH